MVPETANGIHYEWNNTGRTYRCKTLILQCSMHSTLQSCSDYVKYWHIQMAWVFTLP